MSSTKWSEYADYLREIADDLEGDRHLDFDDTRHLESIVADITDALTKGDL